MFPSWSWASVVKFEPPRLHLPALPLVEVIDVKMSPREGDLYGSIASGTITLRCMMLPGFALGTSSIWDREFCCTNHQSQTDGDLSNTTSEYASSTPGISEQNRPYCAPHLDDTPEGIMRAIHVQPDDPDLITDTTSCYAVPLCCHPLWVRGIILRKIGVDTYQRVGHFRVPGRSLFPTILLSESNKSLCSPTFAPVEVLESLRARQAGAYKIDGNIDNNMSPRMLCRHVPFIDDIPQIGEWKTIKLV